MSRKNVETALRTIEAWNRGDREGWLAPAHPDIEWRSAVVRQFEGAGSVHRGREELWRFWDEWRELWSMTIEVVETRDLGDVVLMFSELRTEGISSGAQAELSAAYVYEFEDGLVRQVRAFLSRDEALDYLGLGR